MNFFFLQLAPFHFNSSMVDKVNADCHLNVDREVLLIEVSLNSQYFCKWTNANPMKIFGQLASHHKLLIRSKLSLG